MRISGSSPSFHSADADAAERAMMVLKKQQDLARNVGQALIALIDGAEPSNGDGRINVYA
jgi:hypothetical protein